MSNPAPTDREPDATPAPPRAGAIPTVEPDRPFPPPPPKMRLYVVQNEGESHYVEAPSLAGAIEAWKRHEAELWGEENDETEEPESVTLVHEGAVIRG